MQEEIENLLKDYEKINTKIDTKINEFDNVTTDKFSLIFISFLSEIYSDFLDSNINEKIIIELGKFSDIFLKQIIEFDEAQIIQFSTNPMKQSKSLF